MSAQSRSLYARCKSKIASSRFPNPRIRHNKEVIRICESRVRFGEIRVAVDRLLKISERFSVAIDCELISELASLQK
jgi:hypothetical protein